MLTIQPGTGHSPFLIPEIYAARDKADIVLASRYCRTGFTHASRSRRLAAWAGNRLFGAILDLPVSDLTSSFRLYSRRVLEGIGIHGLGYDALLDTLVRAHAAGFSMTEVPFHYFPESRGMDPPAWDVGRDCLRTIPALWRLRNSIDCSDYDERAHNSRVWFQRSWQRRRYNALVRMARDCPTVLDIGCGSSQVIDGLPQSDCCDIRLNKLRHKRAPGRNLARASVFALPYPDARYDAAIFSQVIEHLPRDRRILSEVVRVVRPGGYAIVGTPDYATWWTTIEKIYGAVHPGGYADEHITHYTFDTLRAEMETHGCTYVDHAYVWGAELIMRFRKQTQA